MDYKKNRPRVRVRGDSDSKIIQPKITKNNKTKKKQLPTKGKGQGNSDKKTNKTYLSKKKKNQLKINYKKKDRG